MQMNTSHAIIGMVLGVASLGAYWMGRSTSPPPNAKGMASSGTELDDSDKGPRVESDVAGLERRLAMLEMRQAVAVAPSAGAAIAPNVSAQAEQEQLPNAEDEERANREASQKAEVAKRFATESRDRTWATSTEEQIRRTVQTIAGEAEAKTISGLSCLTTVCRLQMPAKDNGGASGPQTDTVLPAQVPNMAGFQVENIKDPATGKTNVTYTFFRSGYPMPE